VPCWSSRAADCQMTFTSAVGSTLVASQVSGAASAPASDTSSGMISGTFLCRVSHKMMVVAA
jgi:hypothetical protein